jgi:Holliday junction resolvase RusA-like endonuclease
MKTRWRLNVDTPVVAKQRARLSTRRKAGKRVAYTPLATRSFETVVADKWKQTYPGHTPLNVPVKIQISITREGFSLNVARKEESTRPVGIRGDIDNYVKSILDGLNGVAWTDDKLVESVTVTFDGEPRGKNGNRKPR